MKDIIEGIAAFQKDVFPAHRALFQSLAHGQTPNVMFITCSDSRVDPSLITQTAPGQLFVLRNAGNLVPRHGAEAATIEYAVEMLAVEHIVVCGHSGCGAMKALMEGGVTLPGLSRWLALAEAVRVEVRKTHADAAPDVQARQAVFTNVVHQMQQLMRHPVVARAVSGGRLQLHAWVYDIPSAAVWAWDPSDQTLHDLTEVDEERTLVTVLEDAPPLTYGEDWVDLGDVDVVLDQVGLNWAEVVDAVQQITGLGNEAAHRLVATAPSVVMSGVRDDEAAIVEAWLREAGAAVRLMRR